VTLRPKVLVVILALFVLLVLPSAVGARTADDPVLIAQVGTASAPDAFRITLTDASGKVVTRIPAGEYQIHAQDFSTMHNFHLFGPGNVNEFTPVETADDQTWTVTLVNGTYTYQCDAHVTQMRGSFAVGPPPPPAPKPVKLTASVKAGGAVNLRRGAAKVTSLKAGRYSIAVADASAKENFHLLGPGANAKTGIPFKGSKTLAVTLRKGVYHYRSDAHPKLGRALPVTVAAR